MWWYRDKKDGPKEPAKAAPGSRPASASPAARGLREDVLAALRHVAAGRSPDPDAWLLMSLLVDGVLETAAGPALEAVPIQDAERYVAAAFGGDPPLRLYNRFTKDFGEGASTRADLPAAHRAALDALRAALSSAPGVRSYRSR